MAKGDEPQAGAATTETHADEALEAAQAALRDGLDEAHAYLKRHWNERPLTVVAAALGAGLVIGLLLGRRR